MLICQACSTQSLNCCCVKPAGTITYSPLGSLGTVGCGYMIMPHHVPSYPGLAMLFQAMSLSNSLEPAAHEPEDAPDIPRLRADAQDDPDQLRSGPTKPAYRCPAAAVPPVKQLVRQRRRLPAVVSPLQARGWPVHSADLADVPLFEGIGHEAPLPNPARRVNTKARTCETRAHRN